MTLSEIDIGAESQVRGSGDFVPKVVAIRHVAAHLYVYNGAGGLMTHAQVYTAGPPSCPSQ